MQDNAVNQRQQSSRGGGRPVPTALLQRQKMLQQFQQRPGTGLKFADGWSPESSRSGGNSMPTALLQRQKMLQQLQQRNQGRPQYSTGYKPGPAFFGDSARQPTTFSNANDGNVPTYTQGGVRLPQMGGGFLGRLAPLGINYGMIA